MNDLVQLTMKPDMDQLPDYIFQLPLPDRPKRLSREPLIQNGFRYRIDLPQTQPHPLSDLGYNLQHGLIGSYRMSTDMAEMIAIDPSAHRIEGFVWDANLLSPELKQAISYDTGPARSTEANRLTFLDIRMDSPQIHLTDKFPVLAIAPRFELEWHTAAHASQLGLVQLVETSRSMLLESGETQLLLDTEMTGSNPVLYLSGPSDEQAVKPVCAYQDQGQKIRFEFSTPISQTIPSEVGGNPIQSVSVLEKYTLYFMENTDPKIPDEYIWVPVCLPITWGWSIRVQQRYDGIWDISRKKLIMPTPSTEVLALPLWTSNTLHCRGPAA